MKLRPAISATALATGLALALSVSSAQSPRDAGQSPATQSSRNLGPAELRDYIGEREPLARYVPLESTVYFRMSSPEKWQALFQRAFAANDPDGDRLRELLAGRPRVIALPSWHERREKITVCEPRDPATFAEILRTSSAQLVREDGEVKIHHFPDGQSVASNGRTFVFSDIGVGSAMFAQSARLLAGEKRDSLLDDRRFQNYARQVDPTAAGLIFLNGSSDRHDAEAGLAEARPRWMPDLDSGCAAIQLEEGRVRCKLIIDRRELRLPTTEAIDARQLKLLPASTTAVWMTPIDFAGLIELAGRHLPRGKPSFYRQLAGTLANSDFAGLLPPSEVGPRSTLCLLAGDGQSGALRMAYIVEARQASAAAATLAEICRGISRIINAQQGTAEHEVSFSSTQYKDQVMHELTSIRVKDTADARLPRELHPTFCAIGDQLVLGSDPGVVREIIDTGEQEKPSLPVFEEWGVAARSASDDTQARALVNPGQLALELAPFAQLLKAENSDLLQNEWFQSLRDYFNDTPVQLGARLRRDNSQTPGKVYVMHVLEGRPADGKLRTGDYIIGIDGELLALSDSTSDLRKKLQSMPGGGTRLLRIERNDRVIDVEVLLPRLSEKSFRGVLDDTSRAIGHLADLGKAVDVITYRQFGSDPSRLEAEIELRLKPAGGER